MSYHSIFDCKRSLKETGRYVMVGGSYSLIFQTIFIGSLVSLFMAKKLVILPHEPNKNMDGLLALFHKGQVKVIIDKRYRLAELHQAMKYFGERQNQGKVIITL